MTLPNILKEFNPDLVGFSLDDSFTHHRASQFNVAEPAATSRNLPHMASVLVRRIKADPRVDFYNDWKVCLIWMQYVLITHVQTNTWFDVLYEISANVNQLLMLEILKLYLVSSILLSFK